MEIPDFHDIRKLYVQARSGYGTAVLAKGIDKSSAHAEFNAFIQQERDKAAHAARIDGLREGWRQGSWHVFTAMGGKLNYSEHLPIDDNPYETKD